MRPLLLLLLLTTPVAAAERPTTFPDDFKPSPCAAAGVCQSYTPAELQAMGARTQGYDALTPAWIRVHWDEMLQLFAPYCRKLATCYAQPGNTFAFCDDLIAPEMVATCNRYPRNSPDYTPCIQFARSFASGMTLRSQGPWKAAQACAAKTPSAAPRALDVWMVPAAIPIDYNGKVTVYALDPETRVPVKAALSIDGQPQLLAKSAPDGQAATWYAFNWRTKLTRVPNGDGHRDVVAPTLHVRAAGYTPVSMQMPVTMRKMIIEMQPATLKRGKNKVTFAARDSETGQPIEARVMYGEDILGQTNEPLEIELKRGRKRQEIWVTSMYDRYNDVVVAPAER